MQRKLAHNALSPGAVKKYHIIQEDLAALLSKLMLEDPQGFFDHIRLSVHYRLRCVVPSLMSLLERPRV